jgi:hypothetical protein
MANCRAALAEEDVYLAEKNFATLIAAQLHSRMHQFEESGNTFSLFFIITADSSTSTLKAYQLLFDA